MAPMIIGCEPMVAIALPLFFHKMTSARRVIAASMSIAFLVVRNILVSGTQGEVVAVDEG